MSLPTECSSFAVLADRTDTARLLAGQNWDWIEQVRATTVVLDVTRPDAPNFVTIVEAGLLAKVGVNSVGVGLCTNTLISDRDEGRLAVPYHVLLRSVLDSEHGQDAMHRVQQASRANSGNYLIVDDRGFCQDLETTPTESAVLTPHQGALVHANHFLTPGLADEDRYLQRKHHTIARFDNLSASLAGSSQLSEADLRRALADHSDAPSSVCQHPNPDLPVAERTCTVAGVILDPEERTLSYCAGNPCEAPWTTHDVRP